MSNPGQCFSVHCSVVFNVVYCFNPIMHDCCVLTAYTAVSMDTDYVELICVFYVWSVMQCSAALDILFVMDSSYSVGKGGFERSRHYVLKLCEALDISPDKVGTHLINTVKT